MQKYEWPDPIPGYDPVQCKREAHARIRRETEGMTNEEVLEYFRRGAARFDAYVAQRRAERDMKMGYAQIEIRTPEEVVHVET